MDPSHSAAALLVAALLHAPARADADEVRLRDGRVLVGEVTEIQRGKVLQIRTRLGLVEVAAEQVVSIRTDEMLRQALAELEQTITRGGRTAPSPFNDLNLASTAWDYGLADEMWTYLDRALAGIRHAEDRRATGQGDGGEGRAAIRAVEQRLREHAALLETEFLAPRWRDASVPKRVERLLLNVRGGLTPARHLAIVELLAQEPGADDTLRRLARHSPTHPRRIVALEALQRRHQHPANAQFVYRTAILDGSRQVREAAMDLVRRKGHAARAVEYLAPGLEHREPQVRIRTADAFGVLGSGGEVANDAAARLIAAGPNAGRALAPGGAGGGTRGHVAFLQQDSYLRDFEVEVASGSFIADPQVDVLQSGTVMDVKVHSTTIYRTEIVSAYRTALKRMVGSDPGPRPDEWDEWWQERQRSEARATGPTTAARGEER